MVALSDTEVAKERECSVTPHEVAALQRLIFPRTKIGQRVQPCGLSAILFDEPYLVPPEQILVQQRGVAKNR